MRSLVVGDIHIKFKSVLSIIDEIIKEYEIDEVVFLGDYVDDWEAELKDNIYGLHEFNKWLINTKNKGNKVIVLCGNHDFAYISSSARCSGTIQDNHNFVKRLLIEDIKPELAYVVQGQYLCSHAGLVKGWCEQYLLDKHMSSIDSLCTELNVIFLDFLFYEKQSLFKDYKLPFEPHYPQVFYEGLNACGCLRGGYSQFSGPLWADKREILNKEKIDFLQIVGHTPVESVCTEQGISFCDTFSLRSDGTPIGDRSLLLVDNGGLRTIEVYD